METTKIIKLSFIGMGVIAIAVIFSAFISFSNREINLKNTFEQKIDQRTAFYDKMAKIFNQKTQIAVKNDESFRQNVNIIMEGRKDSEQVMFKWITETNPNANYSEVAALYKDLSRSIEAERQGFFIEEKTLQDVQRQHKNMVQTFPGSFYNFFLGREALKYKPITSSITDEVMKTGTDNNTKLDL